jgi:hypothetical protein
MPRRAQDVEPRDGRVLLEVAALRRELALVQGVVLTNDKGCPNDYAVRTQPTAQGDVPDLEVVLAVAGRAHHRHVRLDQAVPVVAQGEAVLQPLERALLQNKQKKYFIKNEIT